MSKKKPSVFDKRLDQILADAERYRFLRENNCTVLSLSREWVILVGNQERYEALTLDAAVDAAMKGQAR